ncbi:MAG: zinc ABC transporter substrate-binding protein [Gammaproteobacteria bacterium]|nr:zinc ABC transporter substrate-binding protein [Gammaproteobacteria bacterium]
MKYRFLLALLAGLVVARGADARVNVFACESEWGALAAEIGGEQVNVTVATTALQDVHQIQARPSLIAAVRKARLVFCSGAGLEAGWLPILIRQAGNDSVQPGRPGNLMATRYVTTLDVPDQLDRSQGDIHAEGNPHIVTDPRNVRVVARVLTDRLKLLDPANAALYEARFLTFDQTLAARIDSWQMQAAPLRGTPIVIRHMAWVYLANWLGLDVVAALEPKPGVPPTSSHLAAILETLRTTPAKAIIVAAYEDPKAGQWLAARTGLPVVTLAYTVGGNSQATDLFTLYDDTINRLLKLIP